MAGARADAEKLVAGNPAGVRALAAGFGADTDSVSALLAALHQVASTDLAIAVLETKPCRQLVGVLI